MRTVYEDELHGMAVRLSEQEVFRVAGLDPLTILSILSMVIPALIRACWGGEPSEASIQRMAADAWIEEKDEYRRHTLARVTRAVSRKKPELSREQAEAVAKEMLDTARRGPRAGSVRIAWTSA